MWKQFLREAKWRYADNWGPWIRYRAEPGRARGEAARVLADLNRDGVAMTTVGALLGEATEWEELRASVQQEERERALEMAEARRAAGEAGAKKRYLFDLLPDRKSVV